MDNLGTDVDCAVLVWVVTCWVVTAWLDLVDFATYVVVIVAGFTVVVCGVGVAVPSPGCITTSPAIGVGSRSITVDGDDVESWNC